MYFLHLNCENMYAIDRSLKQRIPSMGHYPVYFSSTGKVLSKVSIGTEEFIEQHNEDTKYIIDSIIRPRLVFTHNKRDFVQLKFIHNWIEEHCFKKIPQCAFYDVLEEQFADNYNPRYRGILTNV